jgi:hypothetical protein
MPHSAISVEQFLAISRTLIGEPNLDPQLAAAYLERLAGAPEAASLPRLAAELEAIVVRGDRGEHGAIKQKIFGNAELAAISQVIILLWYLGEVHGQAPAGGYPEHYFRGLFWEIVHAHPPALSGGYSGYWAYPPEN